MTRTIFVPTVNSWICPDCRDYNVIEDARCAYCGGSAEFLRWLADVDVALADNESQRDVLRRDQWWELWDHGVPATEAVMSAILLAPQQQHIPAPSGDPLAVWVLDYTVLESGSQNLVTGRQSVHMTRQGAEHALAALLSETVPAGVFRIRPSDQAAEDRLWAAGVPAGDAGDDGAAEIIASHCSESSLCVDLDAAGEGVEIHAGVTRMVVGL